MTFRVLVTDPLGELGRRILEDAPDVEVTVSLDLDHDGLIEVIPGFDALIVRSGTKVTQDVVAAGTRLAVIGRAGVGVDNVDVDAATRRGIAVTNTPDSNTNAAVEQTFALMLAAARHTADSHASLAAGEWDRSRFAGTELRGKTLGIIGFGRIGRAVAAIGQAFGMQVLAYDPYVSEVIGRQEEVTLVELDDLLTRSDVVTLHMAAAERKAVIDAEALELMKRGSILVNVARGWLVDGPAVVAALDDGRLRAVALDVFATEPPEEGDGLIGHPKVLHTPHLGASTEEAQADVSSNIARQVLTILRGEGYPNSVNIALADDPRSAPVLFLAERLGRLHAAMADQPIERIELELTGDLGEGLIPTAATGVLKGILDSRIGPVNHISAPYLAADHGISVATGRGISDGDYPNMLSCRAYFGEDHRTIAGVVFGGTEPRVVRISRFQLDARPEGTVLLLLNEDVPGVIGKVGTTLGDHDVNIAEWRLGREKEGGTAISFINLDSEPTEAALAELAGLPEVSKVAVVTL